MTISIRDLEQRAALGWRAPEEERLGDWLLRAADGFTGRANSALATGHPGCPLDQAARAVQDWYQARGLPAMIAIPYPVGRPQAVPLDGFLAGLGWGVRAGTATVMTAPAGQVAGAARTVRAGDGSARPAGRGSAGQAGGSPALVPMEVLIGVEMDPEPGEEWLALYHYRGQPGLPPIARQVLTSAPWQAFASIRANGQMIAIGRVAAAAGWAGLTAIEVAPGNRRRGLATVVTAALAAQAAAHGAEHVYLQVEDDNEPARMLYRRIGFTAQHDYHYRVAPERQSLGPG
jgi:N-acetylglutamate synthase